MRSAGVGVEGRLLVRALESGVAAAGAAAPGRLPSAAVLVSAPTAATAVVHHLADWS